MTQEELCNRGFECKTLAPTNKAALSIDGVTTHRFKFKFGFLPFQNREVKYIWEFEHLFYVAYCITIRKSKGDT